MLLLHLSDIHFRKGEVGTAMDPNGHLRNELVRDAEMMCKKIGALPAAILLSGDIAFSGDSDEYVFAAKWLDELCSKCGAKFRDVFVIPGNHDVVRATAKRALVQVLHRDIKNAGAVTLSSLLRGLLADEEAKTLLYQSIEPYNLFAGQFFCDLLPPERTIARRDLLLNDGSVLRLSGLNSTFVSSETDKAGDLFVDPAALQISKEAGVEHLVACHHPYSWLRQGTELQDHLRANARMHLFGHEHTNRILPGRDWLEIAASAAHPDRTETGWEPGYNLIELDIEGTGSDRKMQIRTHVRVWQQRPGEFRAKTDKGSDVFAQTIVLDPWSAASVDQTPSMPPSSPSSPALEAPIPEEKGPDPMDSLRDISIRFFKLTISQKSAVAGKLSLLENEDLNQPDFERFRRVLLRARERGQLDELDREVKAAGAF